MVFKTATVRCYAPELTVMAGRFSMATVDEIHLVPNPGGAARSKCYHRLFCIGFWGFVCLFVSHFPVATLFQCSFTVALVQRSLVSSVSATCPREVYKCSRIYFTLTIGYQRSACKDLSQHKFDYSQDSAKDST